MQGVSPVRPIEGDDPDPVLDPDRDRVGARILRACHWRQRRLIPMPSGRSPRKAHEEVAEDLRSRILSGDLAVGDRLPPEDELTEQFGVARTTLREALRVLESQGLIRIRRGRGGGPIVTQPDLAPLAAALSASLQLRGTTIGDLDRARRMIEPQVAGELAVTRNESDVKALREAVADAAAAADSDEPSAAFGLASARFHEALIERSGNLTLTTISALLHMLVESFYARSVRVDTPRDTMRRAVRSYSKLVDLIESGDQTGAVAHWEAQMAYTIANLDPDRPIRT
jgi:DNA-binding FadR family transcriptional regulator